jgi:hypothetical protein
MIDKWDLELKIFAETIKKIFVSPDELSRQVFQKHFEIIKRACDENHLAMYTAFGNNRYSKSN